MPGAAGLVTYAGLLISKGAVYSQKRGMSPDLVKIKLIPQSSSIASIGNLTFSYGGVPLVLNDCLADKSHIWMSNQGFIGTLVFEDRRWRWSRYPLFSAHYNERDSSGERIASTERSLRDILDEAFTHIGEGTVDVSRVAGNFYPEIDAQCVDCKTLIDQLTKNFGYTVCLGFGNEPVVVWPLGQGNTLPSGVDLMAFSETVDPPTPPQYFQVCFGPSVAQARFKMIAIGLETDGSYLPINQLSYTPSGGWDKEPFDMPNVLSEHGEAEWTLARQTVYKLYGINTFADGTLDHPDGSGSLSSISQVLPLMEKLLETSLRNNVPHHPPVRVLGDYSVYSFPAIIERSDGKVVEEPWEFDRYRGVIKFNNPMHLITNPGEGQSTAPADLYLDAAFHIRDENTNQLTSYVWEKLVSVTGQGYQTHFDPSLNARTIVSYDSNHSVSGTADNSATLDAFANSIANSAAGLYLTVTRYMNWYNRIMDGLRLDGLTSQIRHVISDGNDGEPGHYTVASQGAEFDSFSRSSAQDRIGAYVSSEFRNNLSRIAAQTRAVKGND